MIKSYSNEKTGSLLPRENWNSFSAPRERYQLSKLASSVSVHREWSYVSGSMSVDRVSPANRSERWFFKEERKKFHPRSFSERIIMSGCSLVLLALFSELFVSVTFLRRSGV